MANKPRLARVSNQIPRGGLLLLCLLLPNLISGQSYVLRGGRKSAHESSRSRHARQYEDPYGTERTRNGGNYNGDYDSDQSYLTSAQMVAQQLMLHNQELMSAPNSLPLFKQSVPGVYAKGNLKEYIMEPTHTVSHPYSHHGKEGHLFLVPGWESLFHFQPQTHSLHHGAFK